MWFAVYFVTGIAVFLALRLTFKKARIDVGPHNKIWASCLHAPILGVLFWPIFAIASLFWFAADLLHAQGRKEVERAKDIEAKRDKRYDGLDLMQKIDRLKHEVKKRK